MKKNLKKFKINFLKNYFKRQNLIVLFFLLKTSTKIYTCLNFYKA